VAALYCINEVMGGKAIAKLGDFDGVQKGIIASLGCSPGFRRFPVRMTSPGVLHVRDDNG